MRLWYLKLRKFRIFNMNNKSILQKENLPGSFWGITTFFNPVGYKNKYANYRLFRESLNRQGLKLLAVEVVFSCKDFELKEGYDADILVQIIADKNNIMWQKERMLNIGLNNLPKDCDKVTWLDCDVIFKNNNWVEETSKMLLDYKVVQPFKWAVRLPKGLLDTNPDDLLIGSLVGQRMNNITMGVYDIGIDSFRKTFSDPGFYGFAWAARKSVFDKIGFFDKNIMGGGDFIMARAFWGSTNIVEKFYHDKMVSCLKGWMIKIYNNVQGSVCYIDGDIMHLWHGEEYNKWHKIRRFILKKYDFDPNKDIVIGNNGLYLWATNNKFLQKAVNTYFYARREDNNISSFIYSLFFKLYFYDYFIKNILLILNSRCQTIFGYCGVFLKKISPGLYSKIKPLFPDKNKLSSR